MKVEDLSTLAEQLRKEGFEARNLAQVGLTIWEGSEGFFISAEELKELPYHFAPHDFHQVLKRKRTNGHG